MILENSIAFLYSVSVLSFYFPFSVFCVRVDMYVYVSANDLAN